MQVFDRGLSDAERRGGSRTGLKFFSFCKSIELGRQF
jgi:hypothetical protein